MPIYEFRCLECDEMFELLVMGDDEKTEMACPKCGSENFERVMSCASFSMGQGGGSGAGAKGPSVENRTCSSGSCTTWNIPGES